MQGNDTTHTLTSACVHVPCLCEVHGLFHVSVLCLPVHGCACVWRHLCACLFRCIGILWVHACDARLRECQGACVCRFQGHTVPVPMHACAFGHKSQACRGEGGLWSHRDTDSQSRSGAALLSPVEHFRLDTPRQPSGNPNVGLKGPPRGPEPPGWPLPLEAACLLGLNWHRDHEGVPGPQTRSPGGCPQTGSSSCVHTHLGG